MTTYRGSCHCGRVRFEVDAELDHVRVCDCSICRRRGALNHRVSKEQLRLLTPWEDLVLYQWGSHTAKDFFCPVCGILPFRRPSDPTLQERRDGIEPFDGWAVNVRCLEGVDLDTLPIRRIHGSHIQVAAPAAAACPDGAIPGDVLRFDVYGRFRLEVVRDADAWEVYQLGTGTRARDVSVLIPSELPADEIASYLDDLFHELGGPGQSVRRIL